MAGLSHEEGIKVVFRGFVLLGIVTIVEVIIALVGNGHIIPGFTLPKLIMYPVMIGLSLYKAYFIISEFMHMKYEVRGLAMSVILPTFLLIWAIIAFLQEGSSWGERREIIKERNEVEKIETESTPNQTGMLVNPSELSGELRVY